MAKLKSLCNKKMCKHKWGGLNFDYKKVFDYHVGTSCHTPFWDFIIEKHNHHHFPRQFNKEFYNVIQIFRRKDYQNTKTCERCLSQWQWNLHATKWTRYKRWFHNTSSTDDVGTLGK
jgi:hypothetical protein